MKGRNEMKLNHDEMCSAMQQYVDAQFKASPGKVVSVASDKADRNSYGGATDFLIGIDGPKDPPAAQSG